MNELAADTERELSALGPAVPSDEGSKSAMLQTLIADFSREFVGSLVERRPDIKTGRKIKECFVGLHGALRQVPAKSAPPLTSRSARCADREARWQVAPFTSSSFSDECLLEAVRDCEGNHISFPIPPIELLEHLLTHPTAKPIAQLLPPCVQCLAQALANTRRVSVRRAACCAG